MRERLALTIENSIATKHAVNKINSTMADSLMIYNGTPSEKEGLHLPFFGIIPLWKAGQTSNLV